MCIRVVYYLLALAGAVAERAWFDGRFEDIAYFEPFYLKNFVAAKPKDLLKNF